MMSNRRYKASLIIASRGKQNPEIINTAYGEMRSRDGASLKYTSNDTNRIFEKWSRSHSLPDDVQIHLEDPTKSEVKEALEGTKLHLSKYPPELTDINLFFAGHGEYPTGSFVLKDSNLTVDELINIISIPLCPTKAKRRLSMTLDSCYSGSFLIDTIVKLENHNYGLRLCDSMVSSMYDEKSWELSFLEHGAFTFSLLNPGNKYVCRYELARAIDKKDNKQIARYLQGMVGSIASSVAFMTQGLQHSIDCVNGTHFDVLGHGGFSLRDIEKPISRNILIDYFDKAKNVIWEEE